MRTTRKLAARILRKGVLPLVPKGKKLPFLYFLSSLDGSMEEELINLHRISSGGVAIDVGANSGLYSYRMSTLFSKVVAFEINSELTHDLAAYNPGNIEIINKGLSSEEGSAVLYIPVLDGFPLVGWASLAPGNCPDTKIHIEKKVETLPLDVLKIPAVSFMKIDVEGHEVEVLQGAVQTLAFCRPTVLVEVKEKNMDSVLGFFSSLGYSRKSLADLIGIAGLAENHIFVPTEKLNA